MNIAVLVSGGVDSSVALALLKGQGHTVRAFYLKIWLEDELSYLGECPWQKDLSYAQAVCDQLAVPLEIVSLQRSYWDIVVAYTIAEIKSGRTPNPDMLCNQYIKFDAFLKAVTGTFDYIATGHYAQTKIINEYEVGLFCSPDPIKDQTYFLARMSRDQVARALFPIGHLTKHEVRLYAQEHDLAPKDRKDSQGLCFLGKLKFRDFIKHYLGESEGPIIDYDTGEHRGTHQGFWYYTIGQRQGLWLPGGPWYVVQKDAVSNTVYVSRQYYAADKIRSGCFVSQCHWLVDDPVIYTTVLVKLRHGPGLYTAQLVLYDANTKARLILDGSDQGIAPGQFAVFYFQNRCIGSGVIDG